MGLGLGSRPGLGPGLDRAWVCGWDWGMSLDPGLQPVQVPGLGPGWV